MQAKVRTREAMALLLGASLMLSACGGGGGNSLSTTIPTTALSGSAAKGRLTDADIKVYAITDGARGALLGSTRTDSNGNFTFPPIVQTSGPVLVELITSANSFMLDEVQGKIAAPAGLRLRAAIPDIAAFPSVHLTPFSEMAAAAVETRGNITASVIETANSLVETQFLGGNSLLTTRPLKVEEFPDATDDARRTLTKSLTALAAAVSRNDATDTNGNACPGNYGARLKCALNTLSQSLALNSGGTRATIKPGYAAALLAKGLDHLNSGTVKALDTSGTQYVFNQPMHNELAIRSIADKDADYTVSPVDSGNANDILGVKTLLADLKAHATPITDWNENFLPEEIQSLPEKVNHRGLYKVADFIATVTDGLRAMDAFLGPGVYSSKSCFGGSRVGNNSEITCILTEEVDPLASPATDAIVINLKTTVQANGAYTPPYATWSMWRTQCDANTTLNQLENCSAPGTRQSGVIELQTLSTRFQGPVSFHAYGNTLGMGPDGLATAYLDIRGTLATGFNNTTLSGDIQIEGTAQETAGTAPLHSTTLAAGSTLSLSNGSIGNVALKPAPHTTGTSRLSGTVNITSTRKLNTYLMSYIKPKFIPDTFAFRGSELADPTNLTRMFRLTSGTLSGAATNATEYDWTKPYSATNFPKYILQISGDFTLAEQTGSAINTTISRTDFLKRKIDASYSWTAAGSTRTLSTSATVSTVLSNGTGDALADITDTPATTKISIRRQSNVRSGTASRGTNAVGTLDFNAKRVNFKDGSYERID